MRGAPDPRASTGRLRGLTSLAKGSQLSRFPRQVVTPGSFHPSGTLRVHFPWSTSHASAVAGTMCRRRSRPAGTCVTICGARSSCVNVRASGSPAGLSRRPRCDRGELSRRRPPAEDPHTPAAAREPFNRHAQGMCRPPDSVTDSPCRFTAARTPWPVPKPCTEPPRAAQRIVLTHGRAHQARLGPARNLTSATCLRRNPRTGRPNTEAGGLFLKAGEENTSRSDLPRSARPARPCQPAKPGPHCP